jgi:LDH2 family malate/lactate/ureidoglycolate dehydrogenase
MITADSGRSPKAVAPFGGAQARLGTNPICFAVPSNLEGPLVFDMATSAAAAGKINVATARGEQVPPGWLIDAEGKPTTDPRVLKNGGALLPLGGAEGYKGTGLAAIVEIFSGLLTGLGFGVEPTGRHNDGCFMAVFKVSAFRDLNTFRQEVTDFANYLKATPPAQGFKEVFYPGEVEFRKEKERRANGIPVEDATWAKLKDLANGFGLTAKLGF